MRVPAPAHTPTHCSRTSWSWSLSVTAYPFPWGRGVLLLEPIPALSQGEGRVLPGQVASSLQGPHWWAMWGSVSCSRTRRHSAQPGFEPATFQSLVDLLYPLSCNRPFLELDRSNWEGLCSFNQGRPWTSGEWGEQIAVLMIIIFLLLLTYLDYSCFIAVGISNIHISIIVVVASVRPHARLSPEVTGSSGHSFLTNFHISSQLVDMHDCSTWGSVSVGQEQSLAAKTEKEKMMSSNEGVWFTSLPTGPCEQHDVHIEEDRSLNKPSRWGRTL